MTPRLAIIAIVTVTGCSTPDHVTPPPTTPSTAATPTTTTTSSQTPRPTAAPPVTRTLDIGRYREHPCELLTPTQQAAITLPRTAAGPSLCRWEQTEPKNSVTIQLLVNLNYLTQVYLASNKEWVVFDPITVAGQPAVVLNPTTDRTYSSVLIGTGPSDSISVSVTAPDDPGTRARTIAEQIVGNLAAP